MSCPTGYHPFVGRTSLARRGQRHPEPLGFEVSDPAGRIPADLRAILWTALEEEPQRRFQSAEELASRLAAVQFSIPLRGCLRGRRAQAVLSDPRSACWERRAVRSPVPVWTGFPWSTQSRPRARAGGRRDPQADAAEDGGGAHGAHCLFPTDGPSSL